ncbi:MAG: hypothetical protein WBQ34_06160 [Candidatus Acidiferrales bacterium]
MNGGELLRLRFALRGRGVQREWPSTLTNGQKPGKTFQRKIFHGCSTVLSVTRDTLGVSGANRVAVLSRERECRNFKALHDSVDAKMDRLLAENGNAAVNVKLDLSRLAPNTYLLAIGQAGTERNEYPLVLK